MQRKILIVRFSSIGDIVLTSPVIRCVREQLNAEVHFITKKEFAGICLSNPHIAKVHSINSSVNEVKAELIAENYDFVVDLHHNIRSMQVKRICGTKSASFPKLNIEKWLLVNLKWNRMPQVHIVDRYFETVRGLGVKNDGKGLDYFIPANDEVDLHVMPEIHRQGYIAITAAAKFATKEMPLAKLIEVVRYINKPVVILGGKGDSAKGEQIAAACGQIVFNACGKFNLNQSASIIRQAEAVISHDTGMMHIAAAFKKKIFSVWGNTVPELGMYPYLPGNGSRIVEVKNLKCRPCSKIGYADCPKGHFNCMNQIPLADFAELRG